MGRGRAGGIRGQQQGPVAVSNSRTQIPMGRSEGDERLPHNQGPVPPDCPAEAEVRQGARSQRDKGVRKRWVRGRAEGNRKAEVKGQEIEWHKGKVECKETGGAPSRPCIPAGHAAELARELRQIQDVLGGKADLFPGLVDQGVVVDWGEVGEEGILGLA